MKVLLASNFFGKLPPEVAIIEEPFPKNRTAKVIELVEEHYEEYLPGTGMYIFSTAPPYRKLACSIVEVDTSRPWRITSYDGREDIEYLDFKCVDKDLNYFDMP